MEKMKDRFDNGQNIAIKGIMLIPAYIITEASWKCFIAPFIAFYSEDLPSPHTLNAELVIWNQKWCYYCEEKFKQLKQQHLKATGEEMKKKLFL